MTTVAFRDRIICADGQMSFGDRVDQYSVKKIRKINGCLVAGAGRFSSILEFFDWFQEWSDALTVQSEAPHVNVFAPEGINDEDFTGLVIFPDETIFIYEGGKKSYELEGMEYYAVGSGADFALAAMDAGATAEEAVAIAIKRDAFTGGDISSEQLDEEPEEITREKAEEMDKEELLNLLFGEKEKSEIDTGVSHVTKATDNIFEDLGFEKEEAEKLKKESDLEILLSDKKPIKKFKGVSIYEDYIIVFSNPETGDTFEIVDLKEDQYDYGEPGFKKLVKEFSPDYLYSLYKEVFSKIYPKESKTNADFLDEILNKFIQLVEEYSLVENEE